MSKAGATPAGDDGDEYFYTNKITLRDGRILYASQCGKKVFRCRKRKPKSPPPTKS